jgi:hypothetical protein
LDALEDYLEFGEKGVPEDVEPRGARASWRATNESENCPYDLRDLSPWICHQESKEENMDESTKVGRKENDELNENDNEESRHVPMLLDEADAIFTFNELCFTRGIKDMEDAYGTLVQHKVYLFDHSDKMFTSKFSNLTASRYL